MPPSPELLGKCSTTTSAHPDLMEDIAGVKTMHTLLLAASLGTLYVLVPTLLTAGAYCMGSSFWITQNINHSPSISSALPMTRRRLPALMPQAPSQPQFNAVISTSKLGSSATISPSTAAQSTGTVAAMFAFLCTAALSTMAYALGRWTTAPSALVPRGLLHTWTMASTSGGPAQVQPAMPAQSTVQTVDLILEKIKDSDSGANMAKDEREMVDNAIAALEEGYLGVTPRPIDDPKIYDNYEVSYVSVGRNQVGNPAGGRWRGAAAKAIFRTTGLYQNLLPNNLVVNVVNFKFLSCLKGSVVLKGTFAATEAADFVRASFQPPRLFFNFGGIKAAFEIGPSSAVELDCAYLDDRIRLGKGSRGSRFVFKRTKAPEANVWQEVMAMRTIPALVIPAFIITLIALLFAVLRSNLVVGAVSLAFLALYFLVGRNGGIINEDTAVAPATN